MAEAQGVKAVSLLPMNPVSLSHEAQGLTPFRVSLSLCAEGQGTPAKHPHPPIGRLPLPPPDAGVISSSSMSVRVNFKFSQ